MRPLVADAWQQIQKVLLHLATKITVQDGRPQLKIMTTSAHMQSPSLTVPTAPAATQQSRSIPGGTSTATIPSADQVRQRPFKYAGYPEYCRYIASDNDGFLFRRFAELNARVLLSMQHDIECEEKFIRELDAKCAQDPRDEALLNSLTWDKHALNPFPERAAKLEALQPLLHRYSKELVVYSL
jgi:hypothetical protein